MPSPAARVPRGRYDLVITGHISLAPLGILLLILRTAPAILIIHGIDTWSRHKSFLVRWSIPQFAYIIGVSKLTLTRFANWTGIDTAKLRLLPNCVDASRFGPGPKPAQLAKQLGLKDRTVILTPGRRSTAGRCKGFHGVVEGRPRSGPPRPGNHHRRWKPPTPSSSRRR